MFLLTLIPALLALPQEWSRCEFEEVRELSAPATGMLRVESGAGPVSVAGEPGLDEFRVTATLCASSQERLDGLDVTLEESSLRTRYPDSGWSWGSGNYARIRLTVRVPEGTGIDLEDGSGSATIEGVGAVVVEDGSGSLRIAGARGDVRVEDGSGSLSIRDVAGDVLIEDGSGSVTVRSVSGSVMVGDDGSGSLEIEEVGGEVRIEDPGSGRVEVRDVEGGLTVEQGRRRRISWSDVRGAVELPERRR